MAAAISESREERIATVNDRLDIEESFSRRWCAPKRFSYRTGGSKGVTIGKTESVLAIVFEPFSQRFEIRRTSLALNSEQR